MKGKRREHRAVDRKDEDRVGSGETERRKNMKREKEGAIWDQHARLEKRK